MDIRGPNGTPVAFDCFWLKLSETGYVGPDGRVGIEWILELWSPRSKSDKQRSPTANVANNRTKATMVNTVSVALVVSYCSAEAGW